MVEAYIPPKNRADLEIHFSGDSNREDLAENAELLKLRIEEIDRAIFHLERSNREITDFDPQKSDPELQIAIEENIRAIATKKRRKAQYIAKLEQLDPCFKTPSPHVMELPSVVRENSTNVHSVSDEVVNSASSIHGCQTELNQKHDLSEIADSCHGVLL